MIRVDTNVTLQSFEDALNQISLGNDDLLLAKNIKNEVFGGYASLAQLLITWAKKNSDNHKLKIYGNDIKSPEIRQFAQTIHGLTAINFSKYIEASQTNISLPRDELLRLSIPFVLAMHSKDISDISSFNKSTIQIMCIDNARKLLWPESLYQKSAGKVRDKEGFEYLLTACIDVLGSAFFKNIPEVLIHSAARLLHEAFSNTHDHALRDFNGNELSRSVRGVLIGKRAIDIKKIRKNTGNANPLNTYFSNWQPLNDKMKQAHYLDVSIFDSGSGLAQTWLAKQGRLKNGILNDEISLEDEWDAVKSCLNKGFGVKEGNTNGNGLFRIMEVVNKAGGFLRVRTGRLSLVKAFAYDAPPLDSHNLNMEDALEGGDPKLRAWADGTTISVLLPLNQRKNK